MTEGLRPLIAGNWKMNGLRAGLDEIRAVAKAAASAAAGGPEILLCPPATLLMAAAEVCQGTPLRLGGQDCHAQTCGAYTGDLSARMLADAGAAYVILGHSERRCGHHETSEDVRAKAVAALGAGLAPIICVGETQAERVEGRALEVVGAQLRGSVPAGVTEAIVIAYEPVWAIGTGLTPSLQDVAEMHGFIRKELTAQLGALGASVRILYGGSVKPENAADWPGVENVNGVLVGGASLKSADFCRIIEAYR